MKIFLAVLVFVMVLCVSLVFQNMLEQSKRRKSLRARLIAQGGGGGEEESAQELMSGDLSGQARMLSGLMRGMGINVEERIQNLEVMFSRAGIDSKNGPVYYLFFQRVLSFLFALIGLIFMIRAGGEHAMLLRIAGFLVTIIAVFGPYLYLKNKIDHRAQVLVRSFPDTLDLLLICVEAGLALDAALARVCSELARAHPEMTYELNRMRLELAILNDRPRALMNLGERTGMVAFRSLVVALIQSERFGTALTDTLRVLSEDFRLQRLAKAEEKAARLPVLLTLPLILLLMPAFFIIVLGPAIISIMHNGKQVTGK